MLFRREEVTHLEVRRVSPPPRSPTWTRKTHLEERGENLTPIPAPSRSLRHTWGSNHACVTSGLDTLGADFLTSNSSVVVEKSWLASLAAAREAGFSYVYAASIASSLFR